MGTIYQTHFFMKCFMWSIWILHFSHETFSSYWKWQLCNQSFNSRMELSISDHCVYLASSRTSEQRLKLSRWMRNELVLSNEHTELHSLIILYCVIWCYYYILCFNYFHYKFTLSWEQSTTLQIWEQTSCLLCNLLIKTDYLFWFYLCSIMVVQSNLEIRNFLVTLKLFLIVKFSLSI